MEEIENHEKEEGQAQSGVGHRNTPDTGTDKCRIRFVLQLGDWILQYIVYARPEDKLLLIMTTIEMVSTLNTLECAQQTFRICENRLR